MGILVHLPSSDWRNDGWSLVGSAVTAVNQALSAIADDTKYIKAPASKSGAAVAFPVDVTSVPAGAVITSVTIKLRTSTGTGTAPAGTAPSISLQVAAQDDPSRFQTRTIYPTATPTTYEVATYQRDAIGLAWDIFRLNFLFCRVFCYLAIFDLIRCHALYCEVKYRVRPTITVDAPSGTVYSPSPMISWTYSQADGDPQNGSEYKIFTAAQVSDVSFNPGTAAPVFRGVTTGDISSIILPTSLNSDTYWVYVRSYSSFKAVSTWVGRQFTVSGPAPGIPGLSDGTGSAVVEVISDADRGSASINMRDTSNLLSVQVADAEAALDGAEHTSTGGTISRDSTISYPGGNSSWRLTSTTSAATPLVYQTDWVEILGGVEVTGRVQELSQVGSRSYSAQIQFFDSGFNQLSGTLTGSTVTSSTTTWTEATVMGTAPADAVYAKLVITHLNIANVEYVNLDHLGLMYGTNSPWSDGGHMSRNLLSAWYSTGEGTALTGESWVGGPGTTIGTSTATGTGFSGTVCNTMTYAGLSPSIAFRAAGTAFNSATTGNNYTLTAPAGLALGDLMIAYVTTSEYGNIVPPVGWTMASQARVDDGTTDVALYVLTRTATASEPASWTDGTLSVSSARRTAVVVAYSGAADASQQFIGQTSIASGNSTPLTLTTASVNNTDPNAWRVSAFAVSDDQSGGTMTANKNAPSTIAPITYVGDATYWGTYQGSGSGTYIINKATGVVSGDLMMAMVTITGQTTVVAPSGWTILAQYQNNTGNYGLTYAVMYRYAGSSEPNSWTGSCTGGTVGTMKLTSGVAYRNVHPTTPFIANATAQAGSGTNAPTGSVTNTNSRAWRVDFFGANLPGGSNSTSWSSSETVQRSTYYGNYNSNGVTNGIFDSNGAVGTGASSKTGYSQQAFYSAYGMAVLLNPLATVGATVPDETGRVVAAAGASNPYLTTRAFDSAGVAATGSSSLTGIWTPGTGTDRNAMAGWVGYIKPAAAVTAGYVQATMATPVDLSSVIWDEISDPTHMAVTATFFGTSSGTSYLTANFYRANVLISSSVKQGLTFGTSTWVKSAAVFDVPDGTTRVSVTLSVSNRSISDVVAFDRVSIGFGQDLVYRPGTTQDTHPIWSKPQIQYADDDGSGYGDFLDLPGVSVNPPSFDTLGGQAYYLDHTPIPLTNRRYRVRTASFGLGGDRFVSPWGPTSAEISFTAQNWWLKSIEHPENNIQLSVKWDAQKIGTTNTATVFQPIGEGLPVVLTEGYKGNSFTLSLIPVSHNGWVNLRGMLESGETLFLQSDIDHAWWVRPVGDLSSTILATNQRQNTPLRAIDVQFVEVAAPD